MDSVVIQAWVEEVKACPLINHPVDITLTIDPLLKNLPRRRLSDEMSSPSKRQRMSEHSDFYLDPDETLTRPRPQLLRQDSDGAVFDDPAIRIATSTCSTSSFTAVLASRAAFSAPTTAQQASTDTSHSTARSRSTSPTKRFQKTASLLNLVRPVRFTKERDLGSVLSDDAQMLFEALSAVEAKEEILPATLRGCSDFRDTRIRGFMWKSTHTADQSIADNETTLLDSHARLRGIVDDSIASSNLHRSEAAWNCLVYTPLLRHVTSPFAFLEVEPIASAQIMPAFRPLSKAGDQTLSHPSSTSLSRASSASGQDLGTHQTRPSSVVSSVYKMVDFAVVLCPEKELQNLIDTFLDKQPHTMATINQTIYEPLRTRPAPIFIETKTSSGNMDTANVQLGVWVAAWHERMCGIIALGGGADKMITIPVIQVVGSVWTLLFVMDAGAEIVSCFARDTDSIFGIYQLQAAMSALADWTKDTFQPWFTAILTRATGLQL
ncbi:methyltransferase type 11 [Fusarium albosuccineum]|uniref:Methyltransferase type 11 n=1 Tax=Fusarium albosuccineum TaxID=1237068 RepID=A0A8H4LA59_9HYPO|nr:methyltransferase type 11 [Fusarium albosuccineum]